MRGRGFFVWSNGRPSAGTTSSGGLIPGKSSVSPVLVVYSLKNRRGLVRVGITTSKRLATRCSATGPAGVIREAFRQLAPQVRPGVDLVFVWPGGNPHVKKAPRCAATWSGSFPARGCFCPRRAGEGERER